jgi:3-polyprenyl-4-hydroxybenzoate decarboxylase
MSQEKQDIRAVLRKCEKEGDLLHVERAVDPLMELSAVVKALSKLKKIPVLLVEHI